jgi:hypothetical protein
MAPNQRDPNKEMLRVWVNKERLELFRRRAESLGMSMSSIINAFIMEETTKYLKEQCKNQK